MRFAKETLCGLVGGIKLLFIMLTRPEVCMFKLPDPQVGETHEDLAAEDSQDTTGA